MKKLLVGLGLALITAGAYASEPEAITGNWRHVIKKDPVDDKVTCMVMAGAAGEKYPPLLIYMTGMPGGMFAVVGDQYPGSEVAFRIDDNPAVTGEERVYGLGYSQLFSQIVSGGQFMTYKLIEWPSGAAEYRRVSLSGVKEHIAACADQT